VDYLFEISTSSVKESYYYFLGHFEMTRVSIVSLPFSILDIDDSDEPVVLSLHIPIYSSLHPDEVVSI
jgi:hypothetical protein